MMTTPEGWKQWECPKCHKPYDSPIPIFAYSHPCGADCNRQVAFLPKKARKP